MAQIHYGDINHFNAMAFAEPHPQTVQFLEGMNQQPTNVLSETAQQFMDASKSMYDQFMGSEAMRFMRAAGRTLAHSTDSNEIRELKTVDDMQQAPLKMQRYVMANPVVRQWYHDQRLDGYSDTYVDRFPRVTGEDHYDYRRVMNGIVEVEDDGQWYFVEYNEELIDGDRELLADEQFDIYNTWQRMATKLFEGEDDPTSVYNSEL